MIESAKPYQHIFRIEFPSVAIKSGVDSDVGVETGCRKNDNAEHGAEDASVEDLFDDKGVMEFKMPSDDSHFVKDVCVDEGALSPDKVSISLNSAKEEFTDFDQPVKDETEVEKNSTAFSLPVSFDHTGELEGQTFGVHSSKNPGEQVSLKQLLVLENSAENQALCRINFDCHNLLDGRTIKQAYGRDSTTSDTIKQSEAETGDKALGNVVKEVSVGETSDVQIFKGSNLSSFDSPGIAEGSSQERHTLFDAFLSHDNPEISGSKSPVAEPVGQINGSIAVSGSSSSRPCDFSPENDGGCDVCSLCDFNPRASEVATDTDKSDCGARLNQSNYAQNNPFLVEDDTKNSFPVASQNQMDLNFSGPSITSGSKSASGRIPYSGSISLRSDSSATSTRSFAFPILQSEWNSSPVKMAKATRRRGWRAGLLCCKF